jgi:hypothetical protein
MGVAGGPSSARLASRLKMLPNAGCSSTAIDHFGKNRLAVLRENDAERAANARQAMARCMRPADGLWPFEHGHRSPPRVLSFADRYIDRVAPDWGSGGLWVRVVRGAVRIATPVQERDDSALPWGAAS